MSDQGPHFISETEFDNDYRPMLAPSGNSAWEYDELKGYPTERVWSLVDGDDGNGYAIAGYHVVNVFGYVVTEQPWQFEDAEALWFEAGEEDPSEEVEE